MASSSAESRWDISAKRLRDGLAKVSLRDALNLTTPDKFRDSLGELFRNYESNKLVRLFRTLDPAIEKIMAFERAISLVVQSQATVAAPFAGLYAIFIVRSPHSRFNPQKK
jgi:hypothetical protein